MSNLPEKKTNALSAKSKLKPKIDKSKKVSNFTQIDRKDDDVTKLIYSIADRKIDKKDDEIDFYLLTHRIISFVQLVLIIYSLIALTYQLIQRNWCTWFSCIFVTELSCGYLITILRSSGKLQYSFYTSIFLIAQYFQLFTHFSWYLTSDASEKPFFDRFFDPPTFLIFSSIAHAFLIIQSIELIGESKKTDDCSGKVIVESVETQRNEMGRMKMALVEEIVKEDQDFKIHLKITDPSGAPKSLADTDLNTEVSRKFEMNSDYRFIDFSREINTKTSVETSKHQKTTPEDSDDGFLAPNSKFNGCRKQPKPLSPRRIL
ncbi:hypothetical protein L3Y34_016440 [Caenorhabditis briggsae]|uniref:Uncharacterized protein n=1 Tax=Caenorhabditis briggsae TaxID=6238 RepID=A0AAE9DXM7_CAEBR|nr:hypothetical protein L3Y34_016440 [Caenorhabditis briggsae]